MNKNIAFCLCINKYSHIQEFYLKELIDIDFSIKLPILSYKCIIQFELCFTSSILLNETLCISVFLYVFMYFCMSYFSLTS